jgi:16S rRNA (uracil1498-N3)-methyltransferase
MTGADAIELLIGPEGGLSNEERNAAERAGYRPVALGPRVLRTETAAIAALALLQGIAGDLR